MTVASRCLTVLCIGACAVVATAFVGAASPAQALRTCVDRWNQGNMVSWGSQNVRVSIRAMTPRELQSLRMPGARERRCTVSLAPVGYPSNTWICRLNAAGGYECPLITSDGMPPLGKRNGSTNARGLLTLDAPLRGTHATPALPWQQRYPIIDGFIEPWDRSGALRKGLTLNANDGRHYRGRCDLGSQYIQYPTAVRCVGDLFQLDPCFAPTANWNHQGGVVACGGPGSTRFWRFLITRR